MQSANIIVAVAMVLLGYAVFVFMAENRNPLAIPAKNVSDDNRRRHHIFSILAGSLVAISCLAAWFFSRGGLLEGLKASFIAATTLLLLLLAFDMVRSFLLKRRQNTTHEAHQWVDDSSVSLYENKITDDTELPSNDTELHSSDTELHSSDTVGNADKLGSIQREHSREILEKTKTINALESTLTQMRKDTDELTRKAARLDESEAELQSVQLELTALKTRDRESISFSEKTIEKLKSDNLELQGDAELARKLNLELNTNRLELQKLKLDNERYVELGSDFKQKEKELKSRFQQAATKERAGRLKMEVSAKRAVVIARKAIARLDETEKKLQK